MIPSLLLLLGAFSLVFLSLSCCNCLSGVTACAESTSLCSGLRFLLSACVPLCASSDGTAHVFFSFSLTPPSHFPFSFTSGWHNLDEQVTLAPLASLPPIPDPPLNSLTRSAGHRHEGSLCRFACIHFLHGNAVAGCVRSAHVCAVHMS